MENWRRDVGREGKMTNDRAWSFSSSDWHDFEHHNSVSSQQIWLEELMRVHRIETGWLDYFFRFVKGVWQSRGGRLVPSRGASQ